MIIPYSQLSAEALQGIIEEFVTREGTDYGHLDISLDKKCQSVRTQLQTGAAVIVYDEALDTVSIVSKEDLSQ